MDLVAAIVLFLGGLIAAALSKLVADEAKAWLPHLCRWLLNRALAKLPADQRDRYSEEWPADLGEIPGDIVRLWIAIGFQFEASAMARQSRASGPLRMLVAVDQISRVLDFTLALMLMVLLAPLLLLTAMIIALEDNGPALSRQERAGLNGQVFLMYTFRTTRLDRSAMHLNRTQSQNSVETRVGRLLRIGSIDQLPALINVLLGSMSLVGPKPEAPQFVERFDKVIEGYSQRMRVKPGITGWAQIHSARTGDSVEELRRKLSYDLYYVKNRSMLLYIRILAATVAARGERL